MIRPLFVAALLVPLLLGVAGAAGVAAVPEGDTVAAEPAASDACRTFDAMEPEGRAEVNRQIGAIDAAVDSSDPDAFCAASGRLLSVYGRLRDAGLACSPSRGAKWRDAFAASAGAVAQTCQ